MTIRTRLRPALVFLIVTVPVMTVAQQFLTAPAGPPADPNTRYEAVSIRAANDDSGQMRIQMTPGRFEATNVPIGVLVRQALQKPDYQTVGAPAWINTERYSIRATGSDSLPPGAISVMLLNLLKDRFQLATHVETRDQPIFDLVVARADGRLGPDLKPTPAECQATIAERAAEAKAGRPPSLPVFPGPNEPLPCGFGRVAPGIAAFSGRTIAQIIPTLADLVGRPVLDKTGLIGLYDFALKYAPELGRNAGPMGPLPGAPPAPSIRMPPAFLPHSRSRSDSNSMRPAAPWRSSSSTSSRSQRSTRNAESVYLVKPAKGSARSPSLSTMTP